MDINYGGWTAAHKKEEQVRMRHETMLHSGTGRRSVVSTRLLERYVVEVVQAAVLTCVTFYRKGEGMFPLQLFDGRVAEEVGADGFTAVQCIRIANENAVWLPDIH